MKTTGVVVYTDSDQRECTYGEFYQVYICPKCNMLLDHDKARYKTRCCYYCGHQTGMLFDCKSIVVRDRFVSGAYVETVVK